MKKSFTLALLAAVVLAATPAFAQTQETRPPTPVAKAAPPVQAVEPPATAPVEQTAPPARTAPAPSGSDGAEPAPPQAAAKTPTNLRTELIKLSYLDIGTASNLLRAYSTTGKVAASGGPTATMIIVTDTPEVVAKMLQVIKEYDVKPTEIQFAVQIVQGGDGESDEALKNDPVIKDLRNVLKYKGFTHLDGTILRVIEGERAQAKVGPRGEYEIRIRPKYIKDSTGDVIQTEIEFRKQTVVNTFMPISDKTTPMPIQTTGSTDLISTTLMLKAGEKTVVGVSKSDGDKGLILILSGKVTK